MFTLSQIKTSKDATRYFSKDNYYSKKEGIAYSEWLGDMAEDLKLSGTIDPKIFNDLLKGQIDGAQLGRMEKGQFKHIPGYDLTFSAPKSVSIMTEVYNQSDIKKAHAEAVKETLQYVQKHFIETRITKGNTTVRVPTDKALFAAFTHDVSRELDPQLHTHAVLVNATKIADEYKSLTLDKLYKNQKLLGQVYRQNLATRLTDLGYQLIRNTQDQTLFEIKGVPQELIDEFSQRRNQIMQYFEDNNIEYYPHKAKQVALHTRKKKRHVERETLKKFWLEKAGKHTLDIQLQKNRPNDYGINRYIDFAIEHLSEREAAFSKEELFNTALRFNPRLKAPLLLDKIDARISKGTLIAAPQHPDKDRKEALYTTPQAVELESIIQGHIERATGTVRAIGKEERLIKALDKTILNEQQKAAVFNALRSTDRINGIQGDAGVGKTTLLAEFKKLANKEGFNVVAMAPSYQAVSELSESLSVEGFAIDRFLVDKKLQKNNQGRNHKNIWIIDEASMIDSNKMDQILKLAEQQKARVLVVGDHKQLESVGAGRSFKQLQMSGMNYSVVDQRMRQKDQQLKSMVDKVVAHDFNAALNDLSAMDGIKVVDDKQEQIVATAKLWIDLDAEGRKNTVIIAPANEQRKAIDNIIRSALIQEQVIDKKSVIKTVIEDTYTTTQQKKMVNEYRLGDVVRFSKHQLKKDRRSAAIKAQTYYQVQGKNTKTNELILKPSKGGSTITINPADYLNTKGRIDHYTQSKVSLAAGDSVRWMDNNNKYGLKRNTKMTVERVSENFVRLRDKHSNRSIKVETGSSSLLHLSYNYSKTAYGVQGETVKHSIVLADSHRKNTVNQKSVLVAMTRSTEKVTLVTDNVSKLKNSLDLRSGKNTIARTQELPQEQQIQRRGDKQKQREQQIKLNPIPII